MGTRPWDSDPRIRKRPSKAQPLLLLYAAGPGGSWRSRYRQKKADACWGVAPSLLPKQAGARGKTARRDAVQLARVARSGELTPVDVPQGDDEAIRDHTRAREEVISARTDAPCRLKACVRRQEIREAGRAHWSPAPLRWLAAVVGPPPAQPIVLQAEVRTVTEHPERLGRREQARREQVTTGRVPPVVDALQALRGVPGTGAVTRVADMGDLPRFEPPSALRQCLG